MTTEPVEPTGLANEAKRFAVRCAAALSAVFDECAPEPDGADQAYTACVRYILRIAAALLCAGGVPAESPVRVAAARALKAFRAESGEDFEAAVALLQEYSGLGIFGVCDSIPDPRTAFRTARNVFQLSGEYAAAEDFYLAAASPSWLGVVYQEMLSLRPSPSATGLERDTSVRKRGGVFFTPGSLVTFAASSTLTHLSGRNTAQNGSAPARVLDPSMGAGDFLERVVALRSDGEQRDCAARTALGVYGTDIDPVAVDIARFRVWCAAGCPCGLGDALARQLRVGDVLDDGCPNPWGQLFPEIAERGGFDAVVGNPPYLASKNRVFRADGRGGQLDAYITLLSRILQPGVVKPGGLVSMVLPDPFLVRRNAESLRRAIINDWTLLSILHISGAFSDAVVANAVPVILNARGESEVFQVARVDHAADRRSFNARPLETAERLSRPVRVRTVAVQSRCEFFYLLDLDPVAGELVQRIHGEAMALQDFRPPFAPLEALNVRAIYRGEEIGKAAIRGESGDLPVLLGGESIEPFCITWEGRRIDRSRVRKPLERYSRTKILLQKSSPRLVAALDRVSVRHPGYVFPQSVYAIELGQPGMSELYLLCLLNSSVLNRYLWCTATGYKLLQPQIEIEDLRRLPIRRVSFTTPVSEKESLTAAALSIFEQESFKTDGGAAFGGLAAFVRACLEDWPERSDVVHDLLAHLGRQIVGLTQMDRRRPDLETTRRLETARAAAEIIVELLYHCTPAQPAMPL